MLAYYSHQIPKISYLQITDIHTINKNATLINIHKPWKKISKS